MNKEKWKSAANSFFLFLFFLMAASQIRGCGAPIRVINLTEGASVEFEGWSGQGSAKLAAKDFSYVGKDEATRRFLESVSYQITPSSNLSNGDTVQVKAIYSSTLAKLANIQVEEEDSLFTVEGLHGESRSIVYGENTWSEYIDGYEIPKTMRGEESTKLYLEYVKSLEQEAGEEAGASPWIQGESQSPTRRKDTTFKTEDFAGSMDAAYKAAYDFGMDSSQLFEVVPVMEADVLVGYRVQFAPDLV